MKKLAIYVTINYPNKEEFFKTLDVLEKCKVDYLELGVPVTNPYMDGQIIKDSHKQVLDMGLDNKEFYDTLHEIKSKYKNFKLILMTYKEGLIKYDLLNNSDYYDGLLCVDEFVENTNNVNPIQLYNEDLNEEELQLKLKNNMIFAYAMSGRGKTGSFNSLPDEYKKTMKRIRKYSDLDVLIGFGISTKEHTKSIIDNSADGVIIGSNFMKLMGHKDYNLLEQYIMDIKSAL
ncbi:tryptophan synthase, alpha chain [Clostridium amylolyticum]|uniref:tryptophan synthase n=1 Tax=Clostridium amylolyticum TaxID=1121298 RepID=A0A1M6GJZ9_9CLOT|nr:tryptophan synthase subunit alpha [Clostridium amylolyticum]SHJ10287.1 tryptophan synthase, alpha chain [Clostridium amylolyticum]